MSYIEPSSYRETSERLGDLSGQLQIIREAGGYHINDTRYISLTHCREAVLSSRMITTILANAEEKRLAIKEFENLVGVGPAHEASAKLSESSRLGLVVLYQFQIENLLKNLIAILGGTPQFSYYKIAKSIVKLVSIKEPDEVFRILYTPALIRNSFHSSGYHMDKNNPNWLLDIDGCKFEFIINKKISCAGWGHIIQVLKCVSLAIKDILKSKEVLSISEIIEGKYGTSC